MSLILKHSELARVFEISPGTLGNYRAEGMPVLNTGGHGEESQYDAGSCVRWFLARQMEGQRRKYEEQLRQSGTVMPLNAALEKARESKERADKYALENAVRRGDLVEVSSVENTWLDRIRAARSRLLSIPTKAAPLVMGCVNLKEVQSILEKLVDDAFQQLNGTDIVSDAD